MVKINRSWWVIKNKHGETIKVNGGNAWMLSLIDAWAEQIKLKAGFLMLANKKYAWGEGLDELNKRTKTTWTNQILSGPA